MEELRVGDPKEVGPYRLLRRIGSGGMGVVYLAAAPGGGDVALKLIRPDLASDADFRSRFRREVDAGRRVGGLCTARYLDADTKADQPFLVTEYVPGGNLADFVAQHGPLADEQLAGLAVGLAEAIVAMHAAGVIHRDIKPSNVLLAASGPKLVDLGIAHAVDATALTQVGLVMGTPPWMAPEQALGERVSSAADVFAWGATVAFAATGRPPFGEGRPEAVLYRVVHEAPDLAGISPRLGALVARTLEKDPAARPAPEQLLVEVVRAAMAGQLPPGDTEAMAAVALEGTWRHGSTTQLRPAASSTATRPRRHRRLIWAAAAVVLLAAFGGGLLYARNESPSSKVAAPGGGAPASRASSSTTTTTGPARPPSAMTSASLPVVTCPTANGIGVAPTVTPPSSQTVSVPRALVSQLAVFADDQGVMELLGPRGWDCSGDYGADGSGGVQIYPADQTDPSTSSFEASPAEAIEASQTSACDGCREQQACPLFTSAANDFENDFGSSCPDARPSAESVEQLGGGVVGFEDPPGVAGDGNPSGGPYPANGVMTYYSGDQNGSWMETCTLPSAEKALCTAVLDNFVSAYGTD